MARVVGLRGHSFERLLDFLLCLFLIGCGIPIGRLADRNRDKVPRLRAGMTSTQVIEILGARDGLAPQPWRCEASHDSTGNAIDVWYYLLQYSDYHDLHESLLPIVLKDGVVLGMGWGFLLNDVGLHFTMTGDLNRSRIERLRSGMSKEELVYHMSHAPPSLGFVEVRNYGIPQPYRAIMHRVPDDGLIEVWYYLVDYPTGDPWDIYYLTPIVLKDGVLVDRGWDETLEIADQYDIESAGWRLTPETVCPGRNSAGGAGLSWRYAAPAVPDLHAVPE